MPPCSQDDLGQWANTPQRMVLEQQTIFGGFLDHEPHVVNTLVHSWEDCWIQSPIDTLEFEFDLFDRVAVQCYELPTRDWTKPQQFCRSAPMRISLRSIGKNVPSLKNPVVSVKISTNRMANWLRSRLAKATNTSTCSFKNSRPPRWFK